MKNLEIIYLLFVSLGHYYSGEICINDGGCKMQMYSQQGIGKNVDTTWVYVMQKCDWTSPFLLLLSWDHRN